jgi:glycine hydroxymethyltransferase
MRYSSRFLAAASDRTRAIVETSWGMIGTWINLIASASYPFPEVMQAFEEPMFVFPLEGLRDNRYFPGTNVMDAVEAYAEELLCSMFAPNGGYRATIQPHSGTQANQIVYNAVLKPGDTVLSLRPSEGGHISHTVLVGRRNPVVYYTLLEDGTLDYEILAEIAKTKRPKLIVAGGSGYPREVDFAAIGRVARDCGAYLHADVSHTATFIAAHVHKPVVPHADFITFNMMKNMRGPAGGVLVYRSDHHRLVAKGLFPDTQGGPIENVLFAKLVGLEMLARIDLRRYAVRMIEVARRIGTVLARRGLKLVTGGTDSHLLLVDLSSTEVSGLGAEQICEQQRVLLNRNLVPNDARPPAVTSGIRLGSSCITILDYSDRDVDRLADWLADRLTVSSSAPAIELIDELTARYNTQLLPLP